MADPRTLLNQAQKLISESFDERGNIKKGWFSNTEDKLDTAADKLQEAASAFKTQRLSKESGDAFKQLGVLRERRNDRVSAAIAYREAFNAWRREDPEAAAQCLESAAKNYCAANNFNQAADAKAKIGELFEVEVGDNGRAAAAYEQSATWYDGENSQALANKFWLKTADLVALDGKDYYKAIEIYERVAKASVSSNLMRWSIKEYLLKAGICQLCTGDQVGIKAALSKYVDIDPSFVQQREHQLLVDLAGAIETGDQEAFSDKLFQYDQLSKLDKWKTTLLLRVKSAVETQEEDFS